MTQETWKTLGWLALAFFIASAGMSGWLLWTSGR